MRSEEEMKFEIDSLRRSIGRQIDDIITDLEVIKSRIENDITIEGAVPKNNLMDLVFRLGQLSEMRRNV